MKLNFYRWLTDKIAFGRQKKDRVTALEDRVAKLERINNALVKKIVASININEPNLPGEQPIPTNAAKDKTFH